MSEATRRAFMEVKPSSLTLICKLGSICVHAEEMLGPKGHEFDQVALKNLLSDPEVKAWLKKLGPLLPVKR